MAEARYGVVLIDAGAVDHEATAAHRAALGAARLHLSVTAADAPLYHDGSVSRHRICRLNPADARTLRVEAGDMVELVTPTGPPLRAWAVLDETVAAGTLPLDDLGRTVLKAEPGSDLEVRPLDRPEVV